MNQAGDHNESHEPALTAAQAERYSRQVRFGPIGEAGQTRLRAAKVLIVGCGALGTVIAEGLARAGVGALTIADRDIVESSNLQRQLLFTEAHARNATPKAVAAAEAIAAINSEVAVTPVVTDVTPENIEALAAGCALIMDGTDNLETRFLINDVAVKLGAPWVYTGAVGASACSMPIVPGETACLSCILDGPPTPGDAPAETCDTVGVIAPTVLLASAMSLAEALKLLVGDHAALRKSLSYVDCWANTSTRIRTDTPRPDCPTCAGGGTGTPRFAYLDEPAATSATTVMCGRDAVQVTPPRTRRAADDTSSATTTWRLDLAAIERALPADVRATAKRSAFTLRFTADGHALTVFPDGRALIHGTQDPARARAIAARYLGS